MSLIIGQAWPKGNPAAPGTGCVTLLAAGGPESRERTPWHGCPPPCPGSARTPTLRTSSPCGLPP